MIKKVLFIFLTISLMIAGNNNSFELTKIEIVVKNIEISLKWYKENLGFTVRSSQGNSTVLSSGSFELILTGNNQALSEKEFNLPDGIEFIEGYSKIGFVTNNLDKLYKDMIKKRATIFREISEGEFFEGKYFIVTDPDGNYIQIFSTNENPDKNVTILKPFLIGKVVKDADAQTKWYETNFNGKISEVLDLPEFKLKIGYLEFNNIYFELLETKVSVSKSSKGISPDRKNMLGISSITFSADSSHPLLKSIEQKSLIQKDNTIIDNNEDKIILEKK